MPDPVRIFHLARSNAHPLRCVRHAAAIEAKKQIAIIEKLDLSDEDFHHQQLVGRWIDELHRHAAKPR